MSRFFARRSGRPVVSLLIIGLGLFMALVESITGRYVLDTAISLYYGALFNAALITVTLYLILLPRGFTRKSSAT